ncbi:undecaprenyl-diphosphatase [Leptospira kobayashii]|uniref:Undecaprenyl-diphosphatase n=1 Tax=Leptospira kobayashii TaxID=1917830 RepID=A0ABM7UJ30_9LEPT|nr:undecaprenyl-diphosphatase [Leptospira kobayashii]
MIEAATEFLPVSSTGHLFLFSHFFPFTGLGDISESFEDLFDIFIQSGAILSVFYLYYKKLTAHAFESFQYLKGDKSKETGFLFYRNILFGILPILVFGFVFKSKLDQIKQSPYLLLILSLAWFIGGLVMIGVEIWRSRRENPQTAVSEEKHIGMKDAILIGVFQCFALIPGVSRSAATIITARFLGVSKKDSAEFSFFLALPVLTIAGLYKLYKHRAILNSETVGILLFGSIVSFLVCIVIIRLFLQFLRRRSFISFGIYRLILGLVVLIYFYKSAS